MVIFNPGTQQHVLSAGIYQRAGCAKGSGRRPCRSSPPPRIAAFQTILRRFEPTTVPIDLQLYREGSETCERAKQVGYICKQKHQV